MPGDSVLVDQRDKVPLRIAGQGGFAEMRVLRQVVFRGDVQIGEIATPAAGDADFLTRRFGVVNHQAVATCMGGTHHASSASAKNHGVYIHAQHRPWMPRRRKRAGLAVPPRDFLPVNHSKAGLSNGLRLLCLQ